MTGYENWVQWVFIQAGADVHIDATLIKYKSTLFE